MLRSRTVTVAIKWYLTKAVLNLKLWAKTLDWKRPRWHARTQRVLSEGLQLRPVLFLVTKGREDPMTTISGSPAPHPSGSAHEWHRPSPSLILVLFSFAISSLEKTKLVSLLWIGFCLSLYWSVVGICHAESFVGGGGGGGSPTLTFLLFLLLFVVFFF